MLTKYFFTLFSINSCYLCNVLAYEGGPDTVFFTKPGDDDMPAGTLTGEENDTPHLNSVKNDRNTTRGAGM